MNLTPEQKEDMASFIRNFLDERYYYLIGIDEFLVELYEFLKIEYIDKGKSGKPTPIKQTPTAADPA